MKQKSTFRESLRQNGTKLQGGFSSVVGGPNYFVSGGSGLNLVKGCGGTNNCNHGNCVEGCGTTTTLTP